MTYITVPILDTLHKHSMLSWFVDNPIDTKRLEDKTTHLRLAQNIGEIYRSYRENMENQLKQKSNKQYLGNKMRIFMIEPTKMMNF